MKYAALVSLMVVVFLSGCVFRPSSGLIDSQLHGSIIRGDLEQARKALSDTEDPNALATKYLNIAMIHTRDGKHMEMLEILVENGGDINAVTQGMPLVVSGLAFQKMTPELLKWYIEKGYDVNLADRNHRTALAMCCESFLLNTDKGIQMAEILIDNGADVNASLGYQSILRNLVIYSSGKPKRKELLKKIVKAGADLNVKGRSGSTPLWTAITFGKEDMAELLLEYGASHEGADRFGTTALFKAASMGYSDCVAMLIADGADVSKVNAGGYTPLRFAINRPDNEDIVEMLIAAGADVNHVKNNSTVLDAAYKRNTCKPDENTEIVKQKLIELLKGYGAKRAAELKEEDTPIS
jgi:ankyrin repeat protein